MITCSPPPPHSSPWQLARALSQVLVKKHEQRGHCLGTVAVKPLCDSPLSSPAVGLGTYEVAASSVGAATRRWGFLHV